MTTGLRAFADVLRRRRRGRSPLLAADAEPCPDNYLLLADRLDTHLREAMLDRWFPRAIDTEGGGFHQDFGVDWSPGPATPRTIVHQSRQTWLCARAILHDAALRERYGPHLRHGVEYLAREFEDTDYGGAFFFARTPGAPEAANDGDKHVYGAAFLILACVAAHLALDDADALALAQRTFDWLEGAAHDRKHGGYIEAFARDGRPLSPSSGNGYDSIGTPIGYKSQNAHIHLLEAVTALYVASPSPPLRQRLAEMLALLRDVLIVPPGVLNYYFTRDWRAVPMHNSFGHDIETACFLRDAAHALGRDDVATGGIAREMVDHALAWGWDDVHGGFWYAGQAFGEPLDRTKSWWVQAEGMHALSYMHETYAGETDAYWQALLMQIDFVLRHQADRRYGGWYSRVSEDGATVLEPRKAHAWKAGYHDGRAVMEVVERMRRMAALGP